MLLYSLIITLCYTADICGMRAGQPHYKPAELLTCSVSLQHGVYDAHIIAPHSHIALAISRAYSQCTMLHPKVVT